MLNTFFSFCRKTKCIKETYTKEKIDELLKDVQVGDGGITTTKIATGAVTETKLATDAVTSTKIADNSVTAAKIAGDAVYKVGTYTGAEDLDEITGLGFKPSFVIVLSQYLGIQHYIFGDAWNVTYYDTTNKVVNNDARAGTELLTDDGFKLAYTSDIGDLLHVTDKTYTYIAFR